MLKEKLTNLSIVTPDPFLRKVQYLIGLSIIALLISCVYSPVVYLSFSGPDDHWMLLKNPYINPAHYNWDYFKAIFQRVNAIQYSPLNTLYYSLVYKINGFDPYYFHLMNVIIHFLSTISVFYLSKNILASFRIGNRLPICFIVAVIWGIHPLNVEAVAWISGSKILICTLCTIISLSQFISWYLTKKNYKIVISIFLFIISFFFKEQAIITPVMYVLFIIFFKMNESKRIDFDIYEIFFLLITFTITYFLIRFTIEVNYGPDLIFPPIKYYPLTQKFFLICYCLYFYILNLFLPNGLHYNYNFPFAPYDITPLRFIILPFVILLIGVISVYMLRKSKNRNFNLFCIFIGFSQIALELQVLPMTRPAIVADRYMYFPAIPIILMISVFLFNKIKTKSLKEIFIPLFILYIAFLASYCNQMASYWQHFNLIK